MNIIGLINKCTIVPVSKKHSMASQAYIEYAAAGGTGEADQIDGLSVITDPRSLTYPTLVLLISGVWQGLRRIDDHLFQSPFVPLSLCLLFGAVITLSNLQSLKPKLLGCLLGVLSGLCNSIIMYSAVVGGQFAVSQLNQPASSQSITRGVR